jgi:peroxiredoxin
MINMRPRRAPYFSPLPLLVLASAALADDDGRALLERAVAHHAGLEACAVEMEINIELPPEFADMGGEMPPSLYSVCATRDGRVAMRPRGGVIADPFVQDGERWYAAIGFLEIYILRDAVPLDRLLDTDGEDTLPIPGGVEFLRLARADGESGSLLDAETVVDAGVETVAGVACRRLDLRGGGADGKVWVAADGAPWIHRLMLDPPVPSADEPGASMMIVPGLDLVFIGWDDDPDLENAFAIEVDESFTRRDAMPGPEEFTGDPGAEEQRQHESIGQPAPATTLQTLDGDEMSLADLKGRVVVLDFWATWCRPCLMALPGVMEVTAELADRGVVFWAVNQREKPEVIRKLLAEQGWALPVALDPQSRAGLAFGAHGLPFTVVIDREGVIRHVHRGYMPGLDRQLRREIGALLEE